MADENNNNGMAHIEGRLSTVEANYNRLHEDVQGLVMRMDTGFDGIRKQLERAMTDRFEARKTNWGVIYSGIAVLVSIMVLAFAPMIYGLQLHEQAIKDIDHEYVQHIRDGHPHRIEQRLDAALDKSETRLLDMKTYYDAQLSIIQGDIENLKIKGEWK